MLERETVYARYISLLVCLCFCCNLSAQSVLKGKVTDSISHAPVTLANVFLSNTAVGTLSAENGDFVIANFPNGRYELVVSCIGYETYVIPVQSGHLPEQMLVRLKPKVTELEEVIVENYEKEGWAKWGSFFTVNFIGTSRFADDCVFENHEALKFRMNKKKNMLTASADETLVIRNPDLGYVLKYTLTSFEYNFNTNIIFFRGYHLFEEMQAKDDKQAKKWADNRKEAYEGSLMQFLRSLYRNQLLQDKFEVRRIYTEKQPERDRVRKLVTDYLLANPSENGHSIVLGNMGYSTHDSSAYYHKVMSQPPPKDMVVDSLLSGEQIAYGQDSTTAALSFPDKLQVVYPLKKTPAAYARRLFFSGAPPKYITSELYLLNNRPVYVLANGTFFEGADLLTSGYWSWWEKAGNMLPYEYWPPK